MHRRAGKCADRHSLVLAAQGLLGLWLGLLTGCVGTGSHWGATSAAPLSPPAAVSQPSIDYTIHYPDTLEITVAGRPELSGVWSVGPDGRLDLGKRGRLRVEGRTSAEVRAQFARIFTLALERVQVRLAQYNSQQIYLYGQVSGAQRCLPYEGPETVGHLLQRVGGVTPNAAANDVYVIRARIAEGKPPQVFHVDVKKAASGRAANTSLVIQPNDEIYVGETRQSCLAKCVPPCLRPLFQAACDLTRLLPFADRWLGCSAKSSPPTDAQRNRQ